MESLGDIKGEERKVEQKSSQQESDLQLKSSVSDQAFSQENDILNSELIDSVA